jgi:diguanylate cyclase (GGDEF)-like protein
MTTSFMGDPDSPKGTRPGRSVARFASGAVLSATLLCPVALPGQTTEEATPSLETQLERARGAERIPLLVALVAALHADAPTQAMRYGEEALALLEQHPDPGAELTTLSEMGALYVEQGELEPGEQALRRGLALAERQGATREAAECRLGLASLARRRGRFVEAEAQARRAVELAEEASAHETLQRAYQELAAVYEAAGRPAPALEAFKRFKQISDEGLDEPKALRLATLESRYERERREREIERRHREQALAALELSRNQWQRNTMALAALMLLLGGFALYRRQRDLGAVNRRLQEIRLTDSLTGLKNRHFLDHAIEADTAGSRRRHAASVAGGAARQADLVFLLIDIDRFKSVNDEHGHAAGDAVLAQFAEILRRCCRAADHLVRWGGEEFLVVIRFADRAEGALLAERIRSAVAAHTFRIEGGREVRRTCSLGFAPYPLVPERPESLSWEQALGLADDALDAAKRSGRDAWVGVTHASSDAVAGLSGPGRNLAGEVGRGAVTVESSLAPGSLRWSEAAPGS